MKGQPHPPSTPSNATRIPAQGLSGYSEPGVDAIRDLFCDQSNESSTRPMVLREDGDDYSSFPDVEGSDKAGHDSKSENIDIRDKTLSIYHPPSLSGGKTWDSHRELVFSAKKRRESASPQIFKFSDQDGPNGPLQDMPRIEKLRLWRSEPSPPDPVKALEAATKRIIDTKLNLKEKDRLIREKDRDYETITNFIKQLKKEFEQEIQKKNNEIQRLKVEFRGALSPLQPSFSGGNKLREKEYERDIQEKNDEIQALRAKLQESLPQVQRSFSPRSESIKVLGSGSQTHTASFLETGRRINRNILEGRVGAHIVSVNILLEEGAYGKAHESAFRAEKIIEDNKLDLNVSYAKVVFSKARAEYGLGRPQVAVELFNKARKHGIADEDVDPWIERCLNVGEPQAVSRSGSGYFDYLRDFWPGGRRDSDGNFGSETTTPIRRSSLVIPSTPARGSWLPRSDSFRSFPYVRASRSSNATGTSTSTAPTPLSTFESPHDQTLSSSNITEIPVSMHPRSTFVSETGSPSLGDPRRSSLKTRPDAKLSYLDGDLI